jgi:hypothetical protein
VGESGVPLSHIPSALEALQYGVDPFVIVGGLFKRCPVPISIETFVGASNRNLAAAIGNIANSICEVILHVRIDSRVFHFPLPLLAWCHYDKCHLSTFVLYYFPDLMRRG